MEKWHGKVAIVTGASSGIGAATARALASQGMHVLALARRKEKLQELAVELAKEGAPGKVYPRATDLRKEEEILASFAWADKELGGADVLVNNAGTSFLDNFIDNVAGHVTDAPRASMYVGSKHCVTALTKCIRRELSEKNSTIKLTSVSPGVTRTEIFDGKMSEEDLKKLPMLQAEDVAKVIVDALSTSPTCQICEVVLTPVPTKMVLF